jgi:hypothetical protein
MSAPSLLPGAASPPSETVYHAVAEWATHAPRGRLTAWAVGGTVDAVGLALFLPGWWPLALLFTCIASVGYWGLAWHRQQVLLAAPAAGRFPRIALQVAMVAAIAVGTIAALAAFYGAFLMLMGTRAGGPDG